jgi:hypothetical protein
MVGAMEVKNYIRGQRREGREAAQRVLEILSEHRFTMYRKLDFEGLCEGPAVLLHELVPCPGTGLPPGGSQPPKDLVSPDLGKLQEETALLDCRSSIPLALNQVDSLGRSKDRVEFTEPVRPPEARSEE